MDTQHPTPTAAYHAALSNLIEAATEFGYHAARVDKPDHLPAIRQAIAANADHAVEISGEAIIILVEVDHLNAAAWALKQAAEAQAEYWNENGVTIAKRLDAKESGLSADAN